MTRLLSTLIIGALPLLASAQQSAYGQCGGVGWGGQTTCVSGYTCVKNGDYYSQCLPGTAATSAAPVTSRTSSVVASNPSNTPIPGGASGTGKTTRYWDCCKPSCAWTGKGSVTHPVNTCNAQNQVLSTYNDVSGCDSGGKAYMCNNQEPWAVSSTLAYGYAAVRITGQTETTWCCACYELTFTSGPAAGKQMVVQATNTGSDLGDNHFDLAIPGGGVGIFNGCSTQYNAPTDGWGARYGGVSSRAECSALPAVLQPGCQWRFDWFGGSDNPSVSFKTVTCPAALTANTGCVRT